MEKNLQNNNIDLNWDEAQKENQKPHLILTGMSGREVQYDRKPIIIEQDLLDFEKKSKNVYLKTHLPHVTKEVADTIINAGNVKIFVDKSDTDNLKNLLDKISDTNDIVNLTKEHAEIIKSNIDMKFFMNTNTKEIEIKTPSIIEALKIGTSINNSNVGNTCNPIEMELGQSKEQIIDEMLHREADIIMLNADLSKSKKVQIPLTGEVSELHVDYSNDIKSKLSPENDELLSNTIDNYFMNPRIKYKNAEEEIERIYKEVRKYGSMPFKIFDENEYKSYPITKPFFEEKYIPTEKEFKCEAKKLKVTGNFSSLGAAQNELAKRYGFKEYRAIKSRFAESTKSYDNINTILIHTYKLNEIEHSEINDFFFKFRHIFRKLNLAIGILNQGNILENVEPILYDTKLESLHIQENSLMQIYSYFLTENSILFGQIKRNIQKLFQDEKINILKDLERLEIDKKDESVFGLFVGLLEYHIGKSAGDVTLIKNEDGSIGKIFKPKSDVATKVENAVNEILNKNRMQIDYDS